jgi:chaperonin GroES
MAKKEQKSMIIPISDRVLIKPESAEAEKRASGIYVPDTAKKEGLETGSVLAVGEGRRNENGQIIPVRVKVGDKVYYSKYSGEEIDVDADKLVLIPESSISAIIK